MVAFVSAAAATVGAASPFVAGSRPATAARRPLWVPRSASPIVRRSTILSPFASAGTPVATTADAVSPATAKTHTITLLPGDGIGNEIMDATVKVLEAVASRFDLNLAMTSALMGGAAIDATGEPLPAATLD